MNEPIMFKVLIVFKNGNELKIEMTDLDIDTMFDKLWERDSIKWMNVWGHIINFDDVHYIKYEEMESSD